MRFSNRRTGFFSFYWSISYYIGVIFSKLSYSFFILVSFLLLHSVSLDGNFAFITNRIVNFFLTPYIFIGRGTGEFASSFGGTLTNLWNLENRNSQLEGKNMELMVKMNNFQAIKDENRKLKDILNYVSQNGIKNYKIKKVNIINNDNFVSRIEFSISKDEYNKYNEHSLVLDKNGNLIGRVINISNNRAEILLINDYLSKIPAQLSDSTIKLILSGRGDNILDISYFLGEKYNIIVDRDVYTAENGNVIESGIPIGKIVDINGKLAVKLNTKLEDTDFVIIVNYD